MAIIETPNVLAGFAGVDNPLRFAGVPVAGVGGSFAGKAPVGALLVDTTAGTIYQNTGTMASPLWTAR